MPTTKLGQRTAFPIQGTSALANSESDTIRHVASAGVSGAGVWQIEAHPTHDRLVHQLEGIVYYDYRTRERRYLRTHDALSFPRILSDARVHGARTLSGDRWTKVFDSYPHAD